MTMTQNAVLVLSLTLVASTVGCSKDTPIGPDPVSRSSAALQGGQGTPPTRSNVPEQDPDQWDFIHVTRNPGDPVATVVQGPFMITFLGSFAPGGIYQVQGSDCSAPPTVQYPDLSCNFDGCKVPLPTGATVCYAADPNAQSDVYVRGYRPYR